MRLAVTVNHPEHPDQELLKAGFELRGEIIERLKAMGVEMVYVDYPGLEDLDRHMAAYLSPARQVIYNQIRDTIAAVQKTASPTVAFPDYYASTRELVTTLMQQGQNAIYLDHMSGKLGGTAVAHATAVSHLALMIGLKMEQYLIQQRSRLAPSHAREVINLGVAGMLHDIGTAGLPAALRDHSRVAIPEDPKALDEWATHPQRGYDMIKGGVEATAAAAVLHHHQHYDGSGFPSSPTKPGEEPRNSGQRIHVFARILAIADLYDRLSIGEKLVRRPNIEILHLMRTQYAAWLDPEILKVIPSVIPPFPPGMRVKLSDGSEAVTVGLRPERPYEPQVKRIEKREPLELSATMIDLSLEKELRIHSFGGLDVRAMIPDPPPPGRKAQAGRSLAGASA
jgi:HD-GYP domain-containing protein (c-di-GMP phosphodiesterase class II)